MAAPPVSALPLVPRCSARMAVDPGRLLHDPGHLDLEGQVVPLHPALEQAQVQARARSLEVGQDLRGHLALGGGGEAGHGRHGHALAARPAP